MHYEQAKREAGLVDYSDMIALAGRLLRERPEVLATLTSRVDCLVVDEFQDTNPLQFALVWAAHGGRRADRGGRAISSRRSWGSRARTRGCSRRWPSSTRTSASRSRRTGARSRGSWSS